MDLQDMGILADNSFDFFIANHVLEHVADDEKAVSEIKRVVKPNGRIILSIPVCSQYQNTLEDSPGNTSKDRIRLFGQSDHVRGYGMDYKERFERFGLSVTAFTPESEMRKEQRDEFGLLQEDIWLDVNMVCTIM